MEFWTSKSLCSFVHLRVTDTSLGHCRETARLRTVRMEAGCCEVGDGGGVVGGVGVVCVDGVDSGVGGVDRRVVCGFVCGGQGIGIRDDCKGTRER
nr:hypothetical protein [Tanacetum cinerariifolium]